MNLRIIYIICLFFALPCVAIAQQGSAKGRVLNNDKTSVAGAIVAITPSDINCVTDSSGKYELNNIPYGSYKMVVISVGKKTIEKDILIQQPIMYLNHTLDDATVLTEVEIIAQRERLMELTRNHSIQNFTLYEGKKNEIIQMSNLAANTATNNSRQIYGSITGLNIWESDGAGLQLGIGGRGLSPNRTSNFNTRQNGYDISADALGYPESYYTPASEALESIEVIRGAASLQYGTQFGGVLNFIFKKPNRDTPLELTARLTHGSWNFQNYFVSASGASKNKKLGYYAFGQLKSGDGWRANSGFDVGQGYIHLDYIFNSKTSLAAEYTKMEYTAQQPGGLTDLMFKTDPRQSVRNRNWFHVDWNLFALNFTHHFSEKTKLNWRSFGLIAQRQSLGNLERINVIDFNQNRTLINGNFNNAGTEIRLVHEYTIGKIKSNFLAGVRLYLGNTSAQQGDADSLNTPDFTFLHPDYVEGSDYNFHNYNYAAFIEHIFKFNSKFSITPGIRLEHIKTTSDGYYRLRTKDFAGNIISDSRYDESLARVRTFAIAGLGMSYKRNRNMEVYANASQNYRAINFSDMRIQNPNFLIDKNLSDEKGYTADLGIRGALTNIFTYEITAFYLYYNNRIGQLLKADLPPLYQDYRFRTNVAASRNVGIEAYGALNIMSLFDSAATKHSVSVFANISVLNAQYINSSDASINNKYVEMVPPYVIRSGLKYMGKKWMAGFQINYTGQQYSDATNAKFSYTAVEGLIPAYTVTDLSAAFYITKNFTIEASCNNLFDAKYFTRRAESYPGPGIIPSDGRSFFLTLQYKGILKKGF